MGFVDSVKLFFSGGTENSNDPAVRQAGREALGDLLDDQANTDKELRQAGIELVDAVLGTSIAGFEGLEEQLSEIQAEWEELFAPLEDVDPDDYKTNVVRADVALKAIEKFKIEELKKFYFEKFGTIEANVQAFWSEATQTNWIAQMKKGQYQTIVSEVLTMVQDLLESALALRELIDIYNTMEKDLIKEILPQTKPEHLAYGKHRTRYT